RFPAQVQSCAVQSADDLARELRFLSAADEDQAPRSLGAYLAAQLDEILFRPSFCLPAGPRMDGDRGFLTERLVQYFFYLPGGAFLGAEIQPAIPFFLADQRR